MQIQFSTIFKGDRDNFLFWIQTHSSMNIYLSFQFLLIKCFAQFGAANSLEKITERDTHFLGFFKGGGDV